MLGKIQQHYMPGIVSHKEAFFFFLRTIQNKNNCVVDRIRVGETAKPWSYTTPEEVVQGQLLFASVLILWFSWFFGLESLGSGMGNLKQGQPKVAHILCDFILFFEK